MLFFYESNNSLQERESIDDDLGLETYMGRLQIEDGRQQEENGEDPKEEGSPLTLPHPQQVQGESSQDLLKEWKFVSITHKIKLEIGGLTASINSPCVCHGRLGECTIRGLVASINSPCVRCGRLGECIIRFNMEKAETMKTPMSSSLKLDKDEKGAFYSRATYDMGGPITSTIKGIEIHLDPKSICCIFDIAPVGLRSTTRVLPYSCFLTRVFKDAGVDLSRETNFEVLNTYDTYDDRSIGKMKFEEALDGSWGPYTQPSYTKPSFSGPAFTEPTHIEIPPPQAPPTPDHAPWMDLSAHINFLDTCMEDLVVDRLKRQHEEMMTYLHSMFSPPPP
ncbi:hypothetical protein AAG906_022333 [Vitis piasezkii]